MGETKTPRSFVQIDTRVVTEYAPRMGVIALGVYVVLAKFANYSTRDCYPSVQTIATTLHMSRPAVRKALRTLQEEGLIVVKRRRNRHGDTSNLYTLCRLERVETTLPGGGNDVARGWQGDCHERDPISDIQEKKREGAASQVHDPEESPAAPSGASPAVSPPVSQELTRTTPGKQASRQATEGPAAAADLILDHPAVQAYRAQCKATPNPVQRAEIAATVTDASRWDEVVRQWLLAGYRKQNVAGMLDWYKNGIPDRGGTNRQRRWGGSGFRLTAGEERPISRSRETPEESARLDAEWAALVKAAEERRARGEGAGSDA